MLVCTLVAHHTDTANCREKDSSCLPDLVIQRNLNFTIFHVGRNSGCQNLTGILTRKFHFIIAQATDINIVGFLENTNLLWSDVTKDTNSKAWTRERMTRNKMLRHT